MRAAGSALAAASALHYGLIQAIVMHGFNAAVDVRYKRLVLTYSHGPEPTRLWIGPELRPPR